MKRIALLWYLFLLGSISQAGNIKITPILINFKGVAVSGNITIAYADFGSALISRDNDATWEQIRVFDGGEILDILIDGNKMTAFNDRGEIAGSADEGRSWSIIRKLGDSVLADRKSVV